MEVGHCRVGGRCAPDEVNTVLLLMGLVALLVEVHRG